MLWIARSLTGWNMCKRLKVGVYIELKNNTVKQSGRVVKIVKSAPGDTYDLVDKMVHAGAAPSQIVPSVMSTYNPSINLHQVAKWIDDSGVLHMSKESIGLPSLPNNVLRGGTYVLHQYI